MAARRFTAGDDLYADVGVALDGRDPARVDDKEWQRAYKKIASANHPDRLQGLSAEERALREARMVRANEAKAILEDVGERARYHDFLKRQFEKKLAPLAMASEAGKMAKGALVMAAAIPDLVESGTKYLEGDAPGAAVALGGAGAAAGGGWYGLKKGSEWGIKTAKIFPGPLPAKLIAGGVVTFGTSLAFAFGGEAFVKRGLAPLFEGGAEGGPAVPTDTRVVVGKVVSSAPAPAASGATSSPPPPAEPFVPPAALPIIVQPDDNLTSIARHHRRLKDARAQIEAAVGPDRLTVSLVLALAMAQKNALPRPELIRPGEQLAIPDANEIGHAIDRIRQTDMMQETSSRGRNISGPEFNRFLRGKSGGQLF